MYLFQLVKSGLNNVILTRHKVEYSIQWEKNQTTLLLENGLI